MHSHDWGGPDLSRLFGISLIYPGVRGASSRLPQQKPPPPPPPERMWHPHPLNFPNSCLLRCFFWPDFWLFFFIPPPLPSPSPMRSFPWKLLPSELRQTCYLALAWGLLSQENTFAALLDIIFHRQPGGRIVLSRYLYSLPISQVCVYRVSSITILCLL